MLHLVDQSKTSNHEPKNGHRDEVPLPAAYEHQSILDGVAIALEREWQLEHSRVPSLWCPCQSIVRCVDRTRLALQGHSVIEVDVLVVVLIRYGEDVDECCERVDGCDGGEVDPEVVEEGGEAVNVAVAFDLAMTEGQCEETSQADNDECCASGAVASMSLIEEEVFGLAC